MAKIVLDCSLLSKPYGLKRCTWQLMHLGLIAKSLGHNVFIVTHSNHLQHHRFLKQYANDLLVDKRSNCDLYIAKSDAFYNDTNWKYIANLSAFKVCLCNSDKVFRESSKPFRSHKGTPAYMRADLYMPANHTKKLYEHITNKLIPTAHPIDPRMCRFFIKTGLYEDYLNDNILAIRKKFSISPKRVAGFMGSKNPIKTRLNVAKNFPHWIDINWQRTDSSENYIKWMLNRKYCVDLRGYGDKSLRFTEAILFGRVIITVDRESLYYPELINLKNCIKFSNWRNISTFDIKSVRWSYIVDSATSDYCNSWSLRGQLLRMLNEI